MNFRRNGKKTAAARTLPDSGTRAQGGPARGSHNAEAIQGLAGSQTARHPQPSGSRSKDRQNTKLQAEGRLSSQPQPSAGRVARPGDRTPSGEPDQAVRRAARRVSLGIKTSLTGQLDGGRGHVPGSASAAGWCLLSATCSWR